MAETFDTPEEFAEAGGGVRDVELGQELAIGGADGNALAVEPDITASWHIGTGNYHAGTAHLYSDLGMFTCDPEIGEDLTELFNFLTSGQAIERRYRKLLAAPRVLKQALIDKIGREISRHREDTPGFIQFKMNALDDRDITRALYRASQAGVKVDLIVRDTCRLRPGIPGPISAVMTGRRRFAPHPCAVDRGTLYGITNSVRVAADQVTSQVAEVAGIHLAARIVRRRVAGVSSAARRRPHLRSPTARHVR